MATVVVSSGDGRGEYYPLGRRTNVVGRGEALPIQILDNQVSRKHLQIRFDPDTGHYSAIDMGSKNGVFVNGVRITTETRLRDHDRIRLGGTLLLFTQKDSDGDAPAMHRFKRPGEYLRVTDLDCRLEPNGAETPRYDGLRLRPTPALAPLGC